MNEEIIERNDYFKNLYEVKMGNVISKGEDEFASSSLTNR